MSKKTYAGWETIRSVLGKSVAQIDPHDSQSLAWYDFQWKLAVGKDLASVTQVKKISNQNLFVTVSGEVWFSVLDSLRARIINTINQRAGSVLVNRIVFQESSVENLTIKNLPKRKSIIRWSKIKYKR